MNRTLVLVYMFNSLLSLSPSIYKFKVQNFKKIKKAAISKKLESRISKAYFSKVMELDHQMSTEWGVSLSHKRYCVGYYLFMNLGYTSPALLLSDKQKLL